jgi:hypothetical protein
MPRADLVALTADDLATLSTRGYVNEVRRELEGRITGQLTESADGAISVQWSDNLKTELAAGAMLRQGKCSCGRPAVCKHLVRLVMLYQKQAPAETAEAAIPTEPWDPGTISDEELGKHFKPAALAKIRTQFDFGIMAELMRASRPVARFQLPVCTVRFFLPGDLRYTRCDCAKPAPCEHVPLAVWAFRQLPADKRAGTVTAGTAAPELPQDLLPTLETTLLEYAEQGISGAGKGWCDRLTRLQQRCLSADLAWPAEIVAELLTQQECYNNHDARFDPGIIASRVGELILRTDAIRTPPADLPQLLIRGTSDDKEIPLGKGTFWGLGVGIEIGRKSIEATAYLYDCKTSGMMVASRQFTDLASDDGSSFRSFGGVGRQVALLGYGISFHTLGMGELLIQSGRRSPAGRWLNTRGNGTITPQTLFNWHEILPPTYAEEFAEIEDRFATLPPSALRPRRAAEDFHVLRIAQVQAARFDPVSHCVQAILVDGKGKQALLSHPWTSRGKSGAETLLARLTNTASKILFVAGRVQRSAQGLIIHPTAVVFEENGVRSTLQPWIEQKEETTQEQQAEDAVDPASGDVLAQYIQQLLVQIGELWVLGLGRVDPIATKSWQSLQTQGEALGFSRLTRRVEKLTKALEERLHTSRWNPRAAAEATLELAGLARLAQDIVA